MKRSRAFLAVLLALVLLTLPVAGSFAAAEGETSATTGTETPALRKVFSAFFDEGETFSLDKGSGVSSQKSTTDPYYEVIGKGTKRAVELVTPTPKANVFIKFDSKKTAPNDYAVATGQTSPNYFDTKQFTLSASLSTSTSVNSGNLQFKSTEKLEIRPLLFTNGQVTTLGNQLLGNLVPGSFLNVSFTLDMEAHTLVYFVDGIKAYEEDYAGKAFEPAEHVSYGQFYFDNKDVNAGASLIIDNLVISYGTLTADNTAYFKEVFTDHGPGASETGTDPGTGTGTGTGTETGGGEGGSAGASETVVVLRRDFEGGTLGTTTVRAANASVETEADGNKYMRAVTTSSYDFYYQLHAAEAGIGKYATDSTVEAKNSPNYFLSSQLIYMLSVSCGDAAVAFGLQSKNPGKTLTKTYLNGNANGELTTMGGTKIATMQKGTWTNVAIELNFDTDKIVYYVEGLKAAEENLSLSDERISYFNISMGKKVDLPEGTELRVDNIVFGTGTLSEDFFKKPVTFRVGTETEVQKFGGNEFVVPEVKGATSYVVTMGTETKVVKAGETVRLINDMVFTAFDPQVSLDEGASFRMDAVTGIRFTGSVNKENRTTLRNLFGKTNVSYGILIAPEDYLDGVDFTHEALKAAYPTVPLADVPAGDWYGTDADNLYIAGSIVSLKEGNRGRTFCARSYVAIKMADGSVSYFYSDFDKTKNSANLYDLAAVAYESADEAGKLLIAPYLRPVD